MLRIGAAVAYAAALGAAQWRWGELGGVIALGLGFLALGVVAFVIRPPETDDL